jgi:hypothetical protein
MAITKRCKYCHAIIDRGKSVHCCAPGKCSVCKKTAKRKIGGDWYCAKHRPPKAKDPLEEIYKTLKKKLGELLP